MLHGVDTCQLLGNEWSTSSLYFKPGDDAKTFKAYSKGCELGDVHMCSETGAMLLRGEGVAIDVARAREILAPYCKPDPAGRGTWGLGRMMVWVRYAEVVHAGTGGPAAAAAAVHLLEFLCPARTGPESTPIYRESAACVARGKLHVKAKQTAKAKQFFKLACDGFSNEGCKLAGIKMKLVTNKPNP